MYDGADVYDRVLERIDTTDPETSLILRKPSGFHHNGGERDGFKEGDRSSYDTILRWILEGFQDN